jgi:hypothetical protein
MSIERRFKVAFIAHVPDADPRRHRTVLETGLYRMTTVFVRDDDEAVEVCRQLATQEGVQSFILCPGFSNQGVARVAEAVGKDRSVNVARGDGPSNAAARAAMERAGWFSSTKAEK